MDISTSSPCIIAKDISTWKFPSYFPQNFKLHVQYKDIGRVPVEWKYPSDDLMSFFGELKCLQVWETTLSFPPGFESSPEFLCGFLFHLEPKFSRLFPPTDN